MLLQGPHSGSRVDEGKYGELLLLTHVTAHMHDGANLLIRIQ
jgi:hypothetical protein